ncbi:ribosomal protein S10 [Peptoniphilus ivorii]|uniref:hypothetical protein n=1 Tax=Aedoeadaptatus ivorii TaxID=54006 RepID=UPI0027843B0E|nr:hypothetical protein [Peptoniphilus ivorii]MDQ0507914.1 ribosomal protein S10 [Peptoniphilus ivorii]
MPHAVYGDWLTDDKIDTASEVGFNNQTGKARVNFNRKTIDNPYVIKVVSKVDPKKENINLYSAAKFYGNDGNFTTSPTWLGLNNNILTVESSAGGELPEEVNGTFEELHVYEEYENGKLVNTTTISVPIVEGTKDEQFTTAAKPNGTEENPKEDFELVITKIEKSDEIEEELTGQEVTKNFIPGKDLEVRYVYEKTVENTTPVDPKEDKGTFVETHIYEEYENGKLVKTSEIKIPAQEGTKEEEFTTSAKPDGTKENPKEGFELVPERIEKSDEITKTIDGSEVKDNFVPKKELKVTYVYKKDTKTTKPEGPSDPTPGTPSDPTPGKPWNPGTPGGPVDPTPNKPSEPTPNKPGEPTAPEKQPKDKPSTDKPYAPEKTGVVKKSDKGDTTKKVETKAKDDADKAPQTFDAGVSGYFG